MEFGIIEKNRATKEKYDRLIVLIKESFQKRIKGDFNQTDASEVGQ